jgi:alkaline phosphatase D
MKALSSMYRRFLLSSLLATLAADRARGASPPPAAALTRIALGSCADQDEKQPIWDAVLAFRPELFLFLGDNVYGDVRSSALAELRAAYGKLAAIPGFQQLRREVPLLAIWDDHDYGRNDAGVEFPWKQGSKDLFADFWALPADDPRRARAGIHHAQVFGPPGRRVQVILLDTRWFRSPLKRTDQRGAPGKERYLPDDDPAKTMLGDAQWRWLEEQLLQPADLRLVASSIQVVVEGHGWERWGNLPRERQRLYDLIGRTRANGVIFLSGDRHIGAFYRETAGTPWPLVEMTSSGLTKSYRSTEAGPNRIGALYGEPNFGTIEIDWDARRVALALRAIDGSVQRELSLAFAELGPR